MDPDRRRATRLIVISDLHLGGDAPRMMSRPDVLARFIDGLPARLQPDEALELCIAGDFVDFLAITPSASWTPDPNDARDKLTRTLDRQAPFAEVTAALGRHVAAGHRLSVLLGNHDVELGLPLVEEALLGMLGATPFDVRFIGDGRAYRVGGALVEHGNRYDGANQNDWEGLRAIASAQSRGETPGVELRVSAGSRIVDKVVNPLKWDYPFIDLLQPQGELVALLLFAFEPSLVWHVDELARVLHGQHLEGKNPRGLQPGETRYMAAFQPALTPRDPELAQAFGTAYEELRRPSETVGVRDLGSIAWQGREEGLAAIFSRGERVPAARLQQIRVVLRRLLLDDASAERAGPTGPYGAAAERIRRENQGRMEVVVMGHTHLARHIGDEQRANYINTGTWADVIRVPGVALEAGAAADEALEVFLHGLWKDERPPLAPTYGDLRIDRDGYVVRARLETFTGRA